jgi:hypothetical protein
MAMGKRKRHAKHASMWVATNDLPPSAAHPFYTRLNQILDKHDFDGYVEGLCQRFYADDGRPGLPPGRYFRLLLIGYFEGLEAERVRTSSRSWRRPRVSSRRRAQIWRGSFGSGRRRAPTTSEPIRTIPTRRSRR